MTRHDWQDFGWLCGWFALTAFAAGLALVASLA